MDTTRTKVPKAMSQSPHGAHGGSDRGTCAMNMSFTFSYENVCVIFKWWRITSIPSLVFSMLAIAFFAYLYEYFKFYIYKSQRNASASSTPPNNNSTATSNAKYQRLWSSCWYGLQVGFSFLLMLVYMTYNGWLMLAVIVGAAWGHYFWGFRIEPAFNQSSLACH